MQICSRVSTVAAPLGGDPTARDKRTRRVKNIGNGRSLTYCHRHRLPLTISLARVRAATASRSEPSFFEKDCRQVWPHVLGVARNTPPLQRRRTRAISCANYWSSSEYNDNNAVNVNFNSSNGVNVNNNNKNNTNRVRAFLAFR